MYDVQEKKRLPMNSDVAAFASRAKVVYPINQKYRVSPSSVFSRMTENPNIYFFYQNTLLARPKQHVF